jgi:hypothetical protein
MDGVRRFWHNLRDYRGHPDLVWTLASGERLRSLKGVSAAILPPLGINFGLLTAFIAAQVWNDMDRATTAVNREASALPMAVLLSAAFPDSTEVGVRPSCPRDQDDSVTTLPAKAPENDVIPGETEIPAVATTKNIRPPV